MATTDIDSIDLDTIDVTELSPRQLEVFRLIGQGKTVNQIADELQISKKTVETFRDVIRNKFNIPSTHVLRYIAFMWVQENRDKVIIPDDSEALIREYSKKFRAIVRRYAELLAKRDGDTDVVITPKMIETVAQDILGDWL